MNEEPCSCLRGWFNPQRWKTCYDCYLDRRAEYQSCIWCGTWHSPKFDVCYKCRPIHGRTEAGSALRMDILIRDGRCRNCGSTQMPNIDHIMPCAEGGTADPWNLQVLCHICNQRKGATWWPGCRWDETRRHLVRLYRIAGYPLLDDAQRDRLRRLVDYYAHHDGVTLSPTPISAATCRGCDLPMMEDIYGDGTHPTCVD